MAQLSRQLTDMGFNYVNKSEISSQELHGIDVIVLDTIGELRDFYAISTVSYVGMNHNILEPLMYNKSVIILPGWEKLYPTYPVYKKLTEMEAITEVERADENLLADAFKRSIETDKNGSATPKVKDQLCSQLTGATKKDLDLIKRQLNWDYLRDPKV